MGESALPIVFAKITHLLAYSAFANVLADLLHSDSGRLVLHSDSGSVKCMLMWPKYPL